MEKNEKLQDQTPIRDSNQIDEYIALQQELHDLRVEQGLEKPKKEGKVSRMISAFFERKENKPKVRVRKKTHLLIAIFLGWAGGHRFQTKQYFLGFLYLLLCWSGFSMAMTVVDILIIIPMKADEEGFIEI